MTEIPVKIIVDLSKPEGERESIVALTAEEIAQREVDAQIAAEAEAIRQAKVDAKESAKAKLAALGLSDDEVAALIG